MLANVPSFGRVQEHTNTGGWQAAHRDAGAGASAAQRRSGGRESRAARLAARRPAALAPRASRAEKVGRCERVPIGVSSSTAAAHRATGGLRQRSGGMPARALVPNAAVRSGGAIGVGRAAAAWQQAV